MNYQNLVFLLSDLGFDNSWYHAQTHPIIVYNYYQVKQNVANVHNSLLMMPFCNLVLNCSYNLSVWYDIQITSNLFFCSCYGGKSKRWELKSNFLHHFNFCILGLHVILTWLCEINVLFFHFQPSVRLVIHDLALLASSTKLPRWPGTKPWHAAQEKMRHWPQSGMLKKKNL